MAENFIYYVIYSLISGFTAFFGVDATAHQRLLGLLTGRGEIDPVLTLSLRLGILGALLFSCAPRLQRLLRERAHSSRSHRLKRPPDPIAQLDLRLLRTALMPILGGVLLNAKASSWISGFLLLSLTFLVNAVILFLPRVIISGNKDGRSVSPLDGILLGLGSVIGSIPGFSTMGCMLTAGAVGGLDRSYALEMSLLLFIPLTLGLLVFDIIAVVAAKITLTFLTLVMYQMYGTLAFLCALLSIVLMRYLAVKVGFTGFAYYSLGLTLFSFVFYLVI